jgi:hypothetical protein
MATKNMKQFDKKKANNKEPQVEDAQIISEDTDRPTLSKKKGTQEVKNLVIDPAMSLHRFLAKTGDTNAFVGTAPRDFNADNYFYDATKFYIVVTSDNKTYIVEKEFFDRFFSLKYDIKD